MANMKVDTISSYLSIVGSSLIVFGLTYNIYLYRGFNIDIISYIELGESLLLFLPSLPGLLILLPLTIVAIEILLPSSIEARLINSDTIYGTLFDGALLKVKVIRTVFVVFVAVVLIFFFLASVVGSSSLRVYRFGIVLIYMVLHFPLVLRFAIDFVWSKNKNTSLCPYCYVHVFVYLV